MAAKERTADLRPKAAVASATPQIRFFFFLIFFFFFFFKFETSEFSKIPPAMPYHQIATVFFLDTFSRPLPRVSDRDQLQQ
uniref:Uncharacterized protein n=1 Tax=Candidozyma auris TaxID=498019 RepID=A0A0L0NNZ8_CANAR